MKKQKKVYRYIRFEGRALKAKREIPYEIKLSSRLMLDDLCFKWNKERLATAINQSIDKGNKEEFMHLSKIYKIYVY